MTDRQRRFRTFGTPWLLRCWRSWSAEPQSRCCPNPQDGTCWQHRTATFSNVGCEVLSFPTFPNISQEINQIPSTFPTVVHLSSYLHIVMQIIQIPGDPWALIRGCLDYAPCSSWSKTWFNSLVFWNMACACGWNLTHVPIFWQQIDRLLLRKVGWSSAF